MESLAVATLTKLRKVTSRSQRELRESIDTNLATFTNTSTTTTHDVPFEPFLLACVSRAPKVVAVALDGIAKFLSFGYLRGNAPIPESISKKLFAQKTGALSQRFAKSYSSFNSISLLQEASNNSAMKQQQQQNGNTGNPGKLIDCIVEVICDCKDMNDENVQIQVLRALSTAVTTTSCEVHGQSLLEAIRACYHIQLISVKKSVQLVAKATLEQMVSMIFRRMESFDTRVERETEAALKRIASTENSNDSEVDSIKYASWYPSVVVTLGIKLNDPVEKSDIKTLGNDPTSVLLNPSFPSVLHRDAFLLFRTLCRISMKSVAEDIVGPSTGTSGISSPTGGQPPPSPLTSTAAAHLLTTPSTSTAATQPIMINATTPADDPYAFASKLLSLELLLSIVSTAGGRSFREGDRFILAIRQYLCQSLLQNCTSNYTEVVGLSLQIFVQLLAKFKKHLKAEVEIFMTSIFLKLLESNNASFEHKILVLEVVLSISEDAETLGELFLNYDCDYHSTNDLFCQLVAAVAKLAKGKGSHGEVKSLADGYGSAAAQRIRLKEQEATMVVKALECLAAMMGSLKKAANLVEIEKEKQDEDAGSEDGETAGDESEAPGETSLTDSTVQQVTAQKQTMLTNSTRSAVDTFDRKRRYQEVLADGILKFNSKPSSGISYLANNGHLPNPPTPQSVAQFLHQYSTKLDMTQVGDYLGKEAQYQNGFCVAVLHEYVDLLDFRGMEIDVAIRHFLNGFRLPGEAQKIDRMMEKFAERYFTCTNDKESAIFPSADTAFILSFSIIMLQTDLHNASIAEEKKMTKEGFLRNNRGINDGKDLPAAYLGGIYDRIKATPISLSSASAPSGSTGSSGFSSYYSNSSKSDKQRREAYIRERETMVRQSELLFKRPKTQGAGLRTKTASSPRNMGNHLSFHLVTEMELDVHHHYVKPMFEIIWAPLLATCSVVFEDANGSHADGLHEMQIQLVLRCFQHAVHLAARLGLREIRDAFVSSLSKFTALHSVRQRSLHWKHVEAIKTVIILAIREGNWLADAWYNILEVLSQLSRLQTLALEGSTDDRSIERSQLSQSGHEKGESLQLTTRSSAKQLPLTPFSRSASQWLGGSTSTSRSNDSDSYMLTPNSLNGSIQGVDDHRTLEELNAEIVLREVDPLAADRVFSSSIMLSDSALPEFVLQLCVVSLSECNVARPPRTFSLQKLVEVADMNMNSRSRMVWISTWKVLSRHFTTTGCHDSLAIGFYAIDSLKQLSLKFLEKEELREFNFQRLFLTPFETIMANAPACGTRELVLRCVENLVLKRVKNIKSGWRTIWGVLRISAEIFGSGITSESSGDNDELRVLALGFQISEHLLLHHFDCMEDVFVEAAECLLAFSLCKISDHMSDTINDAAATQHAENTLLKMSVKCVTLYKNVFLEKLGSGQLLDQGKNRSSDEESSTTLAYSASTGHTKLWLPVLSALSTLSLDRRADVRISALISLYHSLLKHGKCISSSLWSLIFKGILLPQLDELRQMEKKYPDDEIEVQLTTVLEMLKLIGLSNWSPKSSASSLALVLLFDLYGKYYDAIGFLPELLFLLETYLSLGEDQWLPSTTHAHPLEKMLVDHGHKFPENIWGLMADELRAILNRVTPYWLVAPRLTSDPVSVIFPLSPTSINLGRPQVIGMYKSVVQILNLKFQSPSDKIAINEELVDEAKIAEALADDELALKLPTVGQLNAMLSLQRVIGTILAMRWQVSNVQQLQLSEGHASNLLEGLKQSFQFSTKVNSDLQLRERLQRKGWEYGVKSSDRHKRTLPSLLAQEMEGKAAFIKVLCQSVRSASNSQYKDRAKQEFTIVVQTALNEYLHRIKANGNSDDDERVIHGGRLIRGILLELANASEKEMTLYIEWLYPLLAELVRVSDPDVRNALADIFSRSLRPFILR